jgi:hypothetical protein
MGDASGQRIREPRRGILAAESTAAGAGWAQAAGLVLERARRVA